MFFFTAQDSTKETITQRLLLRQKPTSRVPTLIEGLDPYQPVEFAKAPNGYIYMVNGLRAPWKWDGVRTEAVTVGVEAPSAAITLAGSGSGSLTGTYTAYARFVDDEGNVGNLSPVSDQVTLDSKETITYSDLPVPTDTKITRRQILRNTSGQATTYYVDVDSNDLSATTLTSTRSDSNLASQTAVPLFGTDGRSLANRSGVPRADKPVIAYFNSRLFMAGDVDYDRGHVSVTYGSATVTGVGTKWNSDMAGRFLYAVGDNESFEVESVESETSLTLVDVYRGQTDAFSEYALRSPSGVKNLIYFTESGRYDAWPAVNALEIASSDDMEENITGLLSSQSFLYILQNRHIYRMTFLEDPLVDGGVFLAARRGCVNNRCWVNVDGFTYMLDDRGIYRFDGGENTEDLSLPIQDLFWFDADDPEFRVNWDAARWFHAVHDRNDGTIRWFVALSGERLPQHAICLNYLAPQWWIESYSWRIGSSDMIRTRNPYPAVSGIAGKVFGLGIGLLDGVNHKGGDTRVTVASAGPTFVSAADQTYPTSGVVGSPVSIVDGKGKGQTRLVTSVSGQRVNVDMPWTTLPDTTSVFQLGAFKWRWRGGWMPWRFKEQNQTRRIGVSFSPTSKASTMDLRIYRDYSETPEEWQLDWPTVAGDGSGVTTAIGDANAEIDLTQAKGYAQLRLDSWKDYAEWRADLLSVELRGFSGRDAVKVYQIDVEGADG